MPWAKNVLGVFFQRIIIYFETTPSAQIRNTVGGCTIDVAFFTLSERFSVLKLSILFYFFRRPIATAIHTSKAREEQSEWSEVIFFPGRKETQSVFCSVRSLESAAARCIRKLATTTRSGRTGRVGTALVETR